MKKVLIILLIGISMIGCSAIIERAQNLNEKLREENQRNETNEGYKRLEKYKQSIEHTFYERAEYYRIKNKVLRFLRGTSGYKIADKYSMGFPYFSTGHISIYTYGDIDIYIDKNYKEIWKMSYKVKGLKYMVSPIREFELKLKDLETKEEIKIEMGEIPPEEENGDVNLPKIKSIEYNKEKIEFEEIKTYVDIKTVVRNKPDKVFEIKVLKNNEEIGVIILKEIGGGIAIKNSVDKDMQEFLIKCFLVFDMHKKMKYEIIKEFKKIK